MVTRVDRKPIIYNTCFLRCVKPAVICNSRVTLDKLLKTAAGYRSPDLNARDILDDYEDIEYAFRLFGIDDPYNDVFSYENDIEDDESIRIARMCIDKAKTARQVMRSEALMEEMCKIQMRIIGTASKVYYGTEAVYQLFNRALWGSVFVHDTAVNYKDWANNTAKRLLLAQSTYLLIHPIATQQMVEDLSKDIDYKVWNAWDMFKKLETITVRIGSRRSMLAHAYYSGINRKGFEPSENPVEDFKLPLTGFAAVLEGVSAYILLGLRYFVLDGVVCVLSHDDCVTLSTMAQCYYRTALYYTKSNGYTARTSDLATTLVKDIAAHCCRLIDAKKNFANVLRSMHILSQGEFNDSFEEEAGLDLGWKERSANYHKEAHELDPMGYTFHKRAVGLACDKIDKLNTCFIYHVFVGDEMLVNDLRSKVRDMPEKVRAADPEEWSDFLNFVKTYTLCRFLHVYNTRPKCGGNVMLLNEPWAERCLKKRFTMPPRASWGKVWIEGEFRYTNFADTWHLEAQDVAYVVKDSSGLVNGKYVSDRKIHSELLMAMAHGNLLDILTGSTPDSARERICSKRPVTEVVLTTAPKAENAKPSWKKRVTYAADCEFRKMQSEYDRNCRRIMGFIRGPSLGVDQCILEKQFADIADATATGLEGAICSHDISAWSESMDRGRKFEFEQILVNMFDKPEMINIKHDWAKINAVVSKQGSKDIWKIDNGSFQGFDGSASTLLHSMILIYCMDTARRAGIMSTDVKTNMATLIDDCIALMVNLHVSSQAKAFWAHLKETYLKLGFEIDDLKSIFSTIKAIYLSRRFLLGGEVPSDYKVFVKAHVSYEDPLRCALDVPGDIFGAMRGACDANGEPWYIYYCACVSTLAEIAHANSFITSIPPSAAAVYALAPVVENGWGFPSIISWTTNDVVDKRNHFNAIMELISIHACAGADFQAGIDLYTKAMARAMYSIKSQAWRLVSHSNIFTNPFEAIREGPLKPDMLRRNAIQDILEDLAPAEPWASLLKWNTSSTTVRVREMLIQSGHLHAPTLSALVNCMPDNYRLSLVGKAIGSQSVIDLLPNAARLILKRRVSKCSTAYFGYTKAIFESTREEITANDFSVLVHLERSQLEREEFYAANGVQMTDHTFPDPVASFTVVDRVTGSVISPNYSSLRVWDKTKTTAHRTSQLISDKGIYVPRRSARVWEVTSEYAKGWDSVSQRIAMGLSILARAEADGHRVEGLLTYFIKSWNELSNITPRDTHLIAIHGSIKRLDANPGSSTHPIICNRNILRGFNNSYRTALDAIPVECNKYQGSSAHLHDFLAHETAMTAATCLMYCVYHHIGKAKSTLSFNIGIRQGCIAPESIIRMSTHLVNNMINIEIMDGADNYGLLQACPALVREISIPTMKSSWVKMINALVTKDLASVEAIRKEAWSTPYDELVESLAADEVYYSPAVLLASEPVSRGSYQPGESSRFVIMPSAEPARTAGDIYTMPVNVVSSRFARALTSHQPRHVVAATAVRSIVWSRLKTDNAVHLAKILYADPDAELDIIKRCATEDFWRAVVTEVNRSKDNKPLSDVIMSCFRSLGVYEMHISHSEDVKEVTHSVASYFGAHLRAVTIIISDLISSVAGRKSSDYSKPFSERIVSNNPSLLNARMRKDHMVALVNSNIEMYGLRIEAILADKISHRGDKRSLDKKFRVVELRCRLYTYKSVEIEDSGKGKIDEVALGRFVHRAACSVSGRLGIEKELIPIAPCTIDDTLAFMVAMMSIFEEKNCAQDAGWIPDAGSLGIRLAVETISMDVNLIMGTKYAVAASEIAPRLHRRVMVTAAGVPSILPDIIEPVPDEVDEDDEPDILSMDLDELEAAFTRGGSGIPIPYWQALYALVLGGIYKPEDVNLKLGTGLTAPIRCSVIREAHFEDFSNDQIIAAFPGINADYTSSGICFDDDWLDRDEADAYTTDELIMSSTAFLF